MLHELILVSELLATACMLAMVTTWSTESVNLTKRQNERMCKSLATNQIATLAHT